MKDFSLVKDQLGVAINTIRNSCDLGNIMSGSSMEHNDFLTSEVFLGSIEENSRLLGENISCKKKLSYIPSNIETVCSPGYTSSGKMADHEAQANHLLSDQSAKNPYGDSGTGSRDGVRKDSDNFIGQEGEMVNKFEIEKSQKGGLRSPASLAPMFKASSTSPHRHQPNPEELRFTNRAGLGISMLVAGQIRYQNLSSRGSELDYKISRQGDACHFNNHINHSSMQNLIGRAGNSLCISNGLNDDKNSTMNMTQFILKNPEISGNIPRNSANYYPQYPKYLSLF